MKLKLTTLSILLFVLFSCSSKKNIHYLQNVNINDISNIRYEDYKIKVDDILKINIYTEDKELFNQINIDFNSGNTISNKESVYFSGFQVGTDGMIHYPSVGKIKASDLTINQLRNSLRDYFVNNQILNNPIIDIKLVNSYFVILGEVKTPGRYEYLKNNISILEALSMAGDLTINGERKNIKLIRKDDNTENIINIDLTKSDFVKESFQIFSGDIIIVNQNRSRVKNAGIIGNSGTLLSLLSFILSSIIVISNS